MAGSNLDPSKMTGINEINITPFVDVVLVLLVIFMVAAPLLSKKVIEMNLPKSSNSTTQAVTTLAIAVTKQGQYIVNGQLMTKESLTDIARTSFQQNPKVQAVISADLDARHGDVVSSIDAVKSAGIDNFAIQVERTGE